ncbi:MAG: ABC transporter ATP-binding protein [Sphingobacteriales bacterium]|nr:MAG: ABC transporter ATP-binding protein [Sphingobacteriales bacterium]
MKKLSRLLHYLADYKGQLALYVLTTLLAILFSLFSFTMLAPVLNVLFNGGNGLGMKTSKGLLSYISEAANTLLTAHGPLYTLAVIIAVLIGATMLKNLFLYISLYIMNPLRNAILRRLRDDLFTRTISLPIGFFTEERKGDLISRMTNDINEVELSIMATLEVFIREPFTILCFLGFMVYLSPQLTLFLILFLPITGFLIGKIGKSLRKHSNVAQEQLGKMLGVIDETLAGMRVVKAFNAEKHQHLRFMQINNLIFRTRNNIAARRELGSPLSETMGVIAVGVILWYGGNLIFQGKLDAGWLLSYIAMFTQIINPFKSLSNSFLNIQKGSAALERIESLMNVTNAITEKADARPVSTFKTSIELRDVHFSYGERKILDGINLKIEKGKTIALVGSSGAGKSTLADLIPRFHDVTSGEILIDGVNLKDCRLYDLRRLMGVVSQEPILFNDTIYNNIILGTGGTTEAQVQEAARIAHAHNFILAKPEGYQTSVGDRGNRLSGGERQRITIARAVLKNPPVLILDEATSSLDTESERMVQEAINSLMKNRTCIVIAHRLSTVQHADEIIVLEKGRIIERGTHSELIQRGGAYRKLVEMQQVK